MKLIQSSLVVLCLCNVMTATSASGASPMQVRCCDVWAELGEYTVEKTGSQLNAAKCEEQSAMCADINLVQRFVTQSNAALDGILSLNPEDAEFSLNVNNVTDSEAMLRVLVWAFIGRTISRPDMNYDGLKHTYLEYDIQKDTLQVRTPSCEFHKSIYTAMVLVSISLLMFLIAVQVVDNHTPAKSKDRKNERDEHTLVAPAEGATRKLAAHMHPLTFRLGP